MARKSKAKPVTRRAPASDDRSERERIIDAFMALLAEKPIEQIGFAEIAKGGRRFALRPARRIRFDACDSRPPT